MRTKEKAYAKLNLALKVGNKSDGYHELDSVVVTVDLYDTVTVETRRDDKIKLTPSGRREYVYNCSPLRDNAYKAAALFSEKYKTGGVNIYVHKAIPLGGGMGGSSADAAAVLKAMAKLYKVEDDLAPLANALGSDTAYLLDGGFARLKGRGEIIEKIDLKRLLHFVVVYSDNGVDTTECFAEFDKLSQPSLLSESEIDAFAEFLKKSEPEEYSVFKQGLAACKNDLYKAACSLSLEVEKAFMAIEDLSPAAVFMTGSGGTVCGIYQEEPLARWAVDKLKHKGFSCEYLYSVNNCKFRK